MPKSNKQDQDEWDYNKFTRADFEKIARAGTAEMSAYLLSHPCPSIKRGLANLHRATHSSIKPPGNT